MLYCNLQCNWVLCLNEMLGSNASLVLKDTSLMCSTQCNMVCMLNLHYGMHFQSGMFKLNDSFQLGLIFGFHTCIAYNLTFSIDKAVLALLGFKVQYFLQDCSFDELLDR